MASRSPSCARPQFWRRMVSTRSLAFEFRPSAGGPPAASNRSCPRDETRCQMRRFSKDSCWHPHCEPGAVCLAKRFVYILRSQKTPSRYYTGVTSSVAARLAEHNAGTCAHTVSGRPWQVDVTIEFKDERRAIAFEKYLKSGSGVAFSKRRLR